MSIYAGLDVSDKTTHICVVDIDGKVFRRDVVVSDPDVLAKWLNKHCTDLVVAIPISYADSLPQADLSKATFASHLTPPWL